MQQGIQNLIGKEFQSKNHFDMLNMGFSWDGKNYRDKNGNIIVKHHFDLLKFGYTWDGKNYRDANGNIVNGTPNEQGHWFDG